MVCVCVCVCARDGPFSFSVLTSASFASVPFFLCSYYYYISIIRYWSPKQVFVEPEQLRKDVVECPQLYSFEKKVDLSYWYIAFLFFCSFYYPIKHYFLPIPPKMLLLRCGKRWSTRSKACNLKARGPVCDGNSTRCAGTPQLFFFHCLFFFLCGELFSLVGVVQPLFFFFFSSFLLFFFLVYK